MRRVVVILVLLLAGAVVNVGVAWALSLPSAGLGEPTVTRTRTSSDVPYWHFMHSRYLGVEDFYVMPVNRPTGGLEDLPFPTFPPSWTQPFLPVPYGSPMEESYRVRAAGCPLSAFACAWRADGQGSSLHWGIGLPPFNPPRANWRTGWERGLPVRPIWLGVAANTLFYAAILWLLICGPFLLRRFLRRRRGLCLACAYPMGEAAVCSECGKPLLGRAEAVTCGGECSRSWRCSWPGRP